MTLSKRLLLIGIGICLTVTTSVRGEDKAIVLKLATLAPDGSTWMKTFHSANKELESRTEGRLTMRAYPGGVMGDEEAVLRKMRIGQIHIGGLTGLGLGSICKDIQVFGTPFLFRNYNEVDYVLERTTGRLERVLKQNGFILLGWSEIGFVYLMSNKPVTSLETFKGTKVWIPEGDPVSQAVFEKAKVSPVPLAISDVLLALQTGLVDVVYGAPIGAISLQWFTKVKYLTRVPLSYALGGVVITGKAFERIPENDQTIFKEIFHGRVDALNAQTRRDNEEALRIMEREGIQFVEPSAQELDHFQGIARKATEEMAGKVFPVEILREVNNHLSELRGER